MVLLKTIRDEDIGLRSVKCVYRKRKTARAVLINDAGAIAVMYVSKHKYHKLPGGGVAPRETLRQGLARELKEETGCTARVLRPVGDVLEFRSRLKERQRSRCYVARVLEKRKSRLTASEQKRGFKLKWMTPFHALRQLQKDNTQDYEGKFIRLREITFLRESLQFLK